MIMKCVSGVIRTEEAQLLGKEVEIGRITVQGQPWGKVSETSSQQKCWSWWYVPVIPAMEEA
jgi:hypothetical protein